MKNRKAICILSFVLTAVLLISMVPSLGVTAGTTGVVQVASELADGTKSTSDGFEYFITGYDEVAIIGYVGSDSEITIPLLIEGYPVTEIWSTAFLSDCCSSIKSIIISSNITYIDEAAFVGCSSLSSIEVDSDNSVYDSRDNCNAIIETAKNKITHGCKTTIIPVGITSIGDSAFKRCSALESITIPDGVTYIGNYAFYQCESLSNVTVPSSVQTIGNYSFSECRSLEFITIPDGVTSVGWNAFSFCSSLKSVTINGKIKRIEENMFSGCTSLTDVSIPSSVTTIDDSAFSSCTLLKSITIPSGVSEINARAFASCSSLESIIIPANVKSISDGMFIACDSLSSVTIPEGITNIGSSAFSGSKSLSSIRIPSSVASIGDAAFSGCSSLSSIEVDPDNSVYDSRDNCNAIIEMATNKLICGCKSTVVPNSVTSIGSCAFDGCDSLNSIEIPQGIKIIERQAFYDCLALESIKIPDGVTTIGEEAFGCCHSLERVDIPSSVTSIGSWAFYECADLTIYCNQNSYAEKYAIENNISYNTTGENPTVTPPNEPDAVYDMEVYSDRSGMNVQVGDTIRLGVVMLKDGAEIEDREVSDISFVLDDSNIVKPLGYKIEDNVYIVEFEALKAGTAYVTFSDAESGFAAKVPVTAYDKSKTSFTLDSIINFVNGYYLKDVASVSGIFADNYSYTVDETTGDATVKFDAYNSSFIYGAVEVYDANGNLADAVVLDKYESGATSLKEIFIENPLYMYSDFVEGNYFSDTFYRAASYSKKTSVSVVIPKGGYINISTDAYSSDVVCIANCIDMLLQVKDVAGDIKGYREASNEFIKLTTEKAVEKIIKESIKPKSIAKKLAKGFSKEVLMTKNSMGDFMDSVVNNINTLDMATFAIETAKGFAFGTGEEVAIALTGPGYKEVIKTLLTVGKITEIGNQYLDFVYSMDCGVISIHNQEGASRTSENVTVKCETSFDNDVALKVFSVVPEGDFLDKVKETEPGLYDAMMKDLSRTFNISMIKNGEETQPENTVEVYIPIDPELLPYTGMGEVKVYRAEDDGTFTDMKAKLDGDFLVFTTEHFSLYVVAIEGYSVDSTEPSTGATENPSETTDSYEPSTGGEGPTGDVTSPSEPIEDKGLLGDVNGDGKVNVKDATLIQKAAAKITKLTDDESLRADVNGDSKVNVKDATAIQKFAAKIETGFPIGEKIVPKENN